MFKYVFMALALFMSANAYAQDMMAPKSAVKRTLTVYTDGGTGNVNVGATNTGSSVLNSWFESGVVVSQNFEKAQWLRLDLTAAIEGANRGLATNVAGDFVGSFQTSGFITGFAKLNLGLTKYFDVALHTAGRLDMYANYRVALAANQSMKFSFGVELFPTGSSLYTVVDQDSGIVIPNGGTTRQVLNFMQLQMTYGVGFARDWGFETDLRFRFNGSTPDGVIRGDSPEAVRQSFQIRWNNTLSYTNPNGLGGYLQLRYTASDLVKTGADVNNELDIVAGVAYTYDMSAL